MYQRTRVVALCAGAVLAMGAAGCADATTTGPIAGQDGAATATASTGDESTSPASTSAAAQTEYGLPTTVAPETDPTVVATDPPVTRAPDADSVVMVTYAVWEPASSAVEEGSFVQGVVESGGTCTLTLTKGETVVTESAPAEPDATTTSCGGIAVQGSRLSSGTWSAVVSYESATTSGSSDVTEVAVP